MAIKQYFQPQLIKTFKSDFNSKIELVNFSGHLRLDMGDLTQSGQVIEHIWSKAFKKLLPADFQPQRVLVLGFGAGSVAKVISHKWPQAQITGVEIDPVVINIAKKYFDVNQIKNLKIINADAVDFISHHPQPGKSLPYDLVLIDCYRGYQIPQQLENPKFLKKIKSLSSTVLINRLFWQEHQVKSLKFLKELNQVFKNTATCRTPSNLVISLSQEPTKS